MLKFSKQIILIAIILFAITVFSQNKKVLQGKREQIEKDIKYTNKLLEKTKKNKEKSLAYLGVLSKQLKNREELLQMLNIEIRLIEKQIRKTTIKIAENRLISPFSISFFILSPTAGIDKSTSFAISLAVERPFFCRISIIFISRMSTIVFSLYFY